METSALLAVPVRHGEAADFRRIHHPAAARAGGQPIGIAAFARCDGAVRETAARRGGGLKTVGSASPSAARDLVGRGRRLRRQVAGAFCRQFTMFSFRRLDAGI